MRLSATVTVSPSTIRIAIERPPATASAAVNSMDPMVRSSSPSTINATAEPLRRTRCERSRFQSASKPP
jgi:hypothetical protein